MMIVDYGVVVTDESTTTKTQILNLAAKLSLRLQQDDRVQSLMTFVLELSRYDADTDLRGCCCCHIHVLK